MLLPGQRPAQEARCPAVGNRVMSTPISAMIVSAARLPDPGDGVEPVTGPGERGDHLGRLRSSRRGDRAPPGGRGGPGPGRTSRAWWSPNRPRSAWRSSGIFLRSLPLASSASTSGSRSPATRARSIARPDTPKHVGGDRVQLDPGVLQGLLDPLALGGVGLDQPLAVAGQVPQLPDRRRRHEAAPQQPVLEQLGQPGGVSRRRSCGRAGS